MKQIVKAVIVLLVFVGALIAIPLLLRQGSQGSKTIVTTNFPAYDFARAVIKDVPDVELKMLISPGAEVHDYEPTPGDIKDIKQAKLFVYTGGESDTWVENLIKDLKDTRTLKMLEQVTALEEETPEGMEVEEEGEEETYDEHVWTSPKNAIKIITKIKDELVTIDPAHKAAYEKNAQGYIDELNTLDQEIATVVKNANRKELIFGDRFPLRYFVHDYGLSYYAAFPGCSDQTEASSRTIAFLIDKIKSDNIPVVFKIELSSGKIAEEISKATGAKVREFHSAHNISKDDYANGVTYLELMQRNLDVLKEALS